MRFFCSFARLFSFLAEENCATLFLLEGVWKASFVSSGLLGIRRFFMVGGWDHGWWTFFYQEPGLVLARICLTFDIPCLSFGRGFHIAAVFASCKLLIMHLFICSKISIQVSARLIFQNIQSPGHIRFSFLFHLVVESKKKNFYFNFFIKSVSFLDDCYFIKFCLSFKYHY